MIVNRSLLQYVPSTGSQAIANPVVLHSLLLFDDWEAIKLLSLIYVRVDVSNSYTK